MEIQKSRKLKQEEIQIKQEIRKKVGNWKMKEIRKSRKLDKVGNQKKVGNPNKQKI